MRIRRKYALSVSFAVFGALPLRSVSADPAVTSFYIDGQVASDTGFTTSLVSVPLSAANPTVVVPVGQYFSFGVSAIVTGNPNSTAGDAWDVANQAKGNPAQPVNLGLASIEYSVLTSPNNSTGSLVAPVENGSRGGNEYFDTATVHGPYFIDEPGDVQSGNGQVGVEAPIYYGQIASLIKPQTAAGVSELAYFGGASATSAQASVMFDGLAYQAVTSGIVGLQPAAIVDGIYYIAPDTPGSVGTGGTLTPASYQQNSVTDAEVNALPVLAVVSSSQLIWSGQGDHATWSTSAVNWNNGASSPSAWSDGQIARFDDTAPANASGITLNSTVSPTELLVASNTNNFTLSGSGAMAGAGILLKNGTSTFTLTTNNSYTGTTGIAGGVLQVGNGGANGSLGSGEVVDDASLVFDLSGSHTAANVISGTGAVTQAGSGTIALTGFNTYGGATVVNNGTLLINSSTALPVGMVSVTGSGTLKLASNIGGETVASLAVAGAGTVDLTNNHLVVDYGSGADPAVSIVAALHSGIDGTAWNGHGIISSTAAVTSGYAVGFYDGAAGTVAGISSGQIELKYTLYGDATLQGAVTGSDFAILAKYFGKTVTGGWEMGDFNYDGVVNAGDFALLAANFGKSDSGAAIALPASQWAALDSFAASNGVEDEIPEPGVLAVALPVAGVLLLRRRRGFAR